jgi:hypothetical protein
VYALLMDGFDEQRRHGPFITQHPLAQGHSCRLLMRGRRASAATSRRPPASTAAPELARSLMIIFHGSPRMGSLAGNGMEYVPPGPPPPTPTDPTRPGEPVQTPPEPELPPVEPHNPDLPERPLRAVGSAGAPA